MQFKFAFEDFNLEAFFNKQTPCCISSYLNPAWQCLKYTVLMLSIHLKLESENEKSNYTSYNCNL